MAKIRDEGSVKMKMLKLWELLNNEASAERPMTTANILKRLADFGIKCDRRTVSTDVETLRQYGYQVGVKQIGHEKGYYAILPEEGNAPEDKPNTNFTTAQLKIIIDAIQAANFIPLGKTERLTRKVAALGDINKQRILDTSVVCFNKRKHDNEEIYKNVTVLEDALSKKLKASFVYFDKNENNERVYRKERQRYIVEPMALVYNEDNYYLMCFSSKYDGITNYRVDRMDEVKIEKETVSEGAIIPDGDISEYTEQVFKMYGGPAVDITVEFNDKLIGVIQDKFGEDTKIVRTGRDKCVASIRVQISPVFWGWIFQFVGEMTIVSPEGLREEYKKRAAQVADSGT